MSNLKSQVHIYSVDTSAFYNKEEQEIERKLNRAYRYREHLNNLENANEKRKKHVNERIRRRKQKLKELLDKNSKVRHLLESHLKDKNIISLFESTLTRTLGIQTGTISKEIIVVQVYYYQILNDIIHNGFYYNGEKYILLTSSAGQIRTKKCVFAKESVWNKHMYTLMCGLTIEGINKQGGMNVNKLLAYLALSNSATEQWIGFNIDKCIVVDDFETNVIGEVDYIDNKTFEIERKVMEVPITHTDGCGMILPSISRKSFMIRCPWIKGLLVPFDFKKFAKENNSYKVKDIYGKEWDVIKDDIKIIFTKSQFKMSKYYSDWQDYKDKFKQYYCQAGICNEEEEIFTNAKLNYQMLQTLHDTSDKELKILARSSNEDIESIGSSKDTMLRILGVTGNANKNNYQKALEMYPELLSDTYSKEVIKQTKKSMVKEAKSGKLSINGNYTFIIPDLYAFCERLFLGIQIPLGLLADGEVSCSLYEEGRKLDVLRSPHLYKEHCIRKNLINENIKKWFITKGIYTSTFDLISKVLQFDCDGDKALVVVDETLVSIAERNMIGIVPLYYHMSVARKEPVNSDSIYKSLTAAFKVNIGEVSNSITKIFNSENINLKVVKWLCYTNNEIIDYAKTLYMSEKPDYVNNEIAENVKGKLPYFFIHAKDKEVDKVDFINSSVVNRLDYIVSNKRINFRKIAGKLKYKMLMSEKNIELDKSIIDKYIELDRKKKFLGNNKDFTYKWKYIKEEILKVHEDLDYVTNVLVKWLYEEKKSSKKETLWECFGDIIVSNLEKNVNGTMQCDNCGIRVKKSRNKKYCKKCIDNRERIRKREWKRSKND